MSLNNTDRDLDKMTSHANALGEDKGTKTAGPYFHQDHARPKSRRDFIAQGFLGYGAFMLMPKMGAAQTIDCHIAPPAATLPYVGIDLAGGFPLMGTFMVGGPGGPNDPLNSYDRMGWTPDASVIDSSMGTPMFTGSLVYQSMVAAMSAAAKSKLRFTTLCHVARDDSDLNQLSPMTLLAHAGCQGRVLPQGLGTKNTGSGGNSRDVAHDPVHRPLYLGQVSDLADAVSMGPAFSNHSGESLLKISQAAFELAKIQGESVRSQRRGEELYRNTICSYERNLQYANAQPQTDPRKISRYQSLYGINEVSPANDANVLAATIAMNVLSGQSGPGVLTIDGCDYHDFDQITFDAKDQEVGRHIGLMIEAAHRESRALFLHLYTDGSMSSSPGQRDWIGGDFGERTMSVIGYYDPNLPADTPRLQVGHYTNGQVADRSTLIGENPAQVAYAVFANYMKLEDRMDDFETIVGSQFPVDRLDEVLTLTKRT